MELVGRKWPLIHLHCCCSQLFTSIGFVKIHRKALKVHRRYDTDGSGPSRICIATRSVLCKTKIYATTHYVAPIGNERPHPIGKGTKPNQSKATNRDNDEWFLLHYHAPGPGRSAGFQFLPALWPAILPLRCKDASPGRWLHGYGLHNKQAPEPEPWNGRSCNCFHFLQAPFCPSVVPFPNLLPCDWRMLRIYLATAVVLVNQQRRATIYGESRVLALTKHHTRNGFGDQRSEFI